MKQNYCALFTTPAIAFMLALGHWNMNAAQADRPALKLVASPRPLVIGHRGYCQIAPENTLPSFRLAMVAGVDLAELDYHQSKDGELIVIHDHELDRTTDATNRWGGAHIAVAAKPAAEIQSLDAGGWFDPKYKGTKVPLLREALDTIESGCVTLIERKAGAPGPCIELLRQKNLINKVVVQSFDWEYLRSFHEAEASQVLGALGPPERLADGKKPAPDLPKELTAEWLDQLQMTGAKVVVWNDKVSKESVRLAHERGLRVWVYTINNLELADQLLALGVDGIISNNPALIWKAIALHPR